MDNGLLLRKILNLEMIQARIIFLLISLFFILGVEESINNEQLKEKRFASVDDEEILKEQQNGSITATKSSMQTRPESLRIMAIRENGGNSTDIFRKESTKTVVKGTEMTKVIINNFIKF